jgi:hypothetical protein
MTTITHPHWCALAHYCTALPAGRVLPARGEHRSEPMRIDSAWGGTVATLVASATTGRAWLELRISVHIPDTEPAARLRADLIAGEVTEAVTAAIYAADMTQAIATDPYLAALIAATDLREVLR